MLLWYAGTWPCTQDTPVHILQTQSVACTTPQHYKFLVLLLEKWRRLRFMVIVKTISYRWSMKETEKVLFFSILGRLYCVCLPNWRETSSFAVLCTYDVIEVRWFDFRSEDTMAKKLWNENPSWLLLKRSHAESCDRPELGRLEHLSPAHMMHQCHRRARASWSGSDQVPKPLGPTEGIRLPPVSHLCWKETELNYSEVSGRHEHHSWCHVKDTEQWKLIPWTLM